jgi:hypothetical protein
MNEEPPWESSLDLTLTQHPHDEDPKPRNMCLHFEVEPPRASYYRIFPNFCTLVMLLRIDPTFNDKLETVYEGF